MEITKELRELARFTAGAMPVLSVYLDTQWRDQHQWERVATFVTRHARQAQTLPLDSDAALARARASPPHGRGTPTPPVLSILGLGYGQRYTRHHTASSVARGLSSRSLNQMDNTTMVPTAKNSLCQFWNDSNQKCAVPRYWNSETGA